MLVKKLKSLVAEGKLTEQEAVILMAVVTVVGNAIIENDRYIIEEYDWWLKRCEKIWPEKNDTLLDDIRRDIREQADLPPAGMEDL